ncbi:MAG: ribonuclease H-like domain-containing protein [Blautia sp.]|nr:ribonuclease H-like domain-containing protein [Blautia sp.]
MVFIKTAISIDSFMKPDFICHCTHGKIPSSPMYYDIETTGLSAEASYVYLIGAVQSEHEIYYLNQWFASSPEEEPDILSAFLSFIQEHRVDCTIQYNGDRFDQPFLTKRYQQYGMDSPLDPLPSVDLYKVFRKLKGLLKLSSMKQPEVEQLLCEDGKRNSHRTAQDGKEGIRIYRRFLKTKDASLIQELLLHNQEDLYGLLRILSLQRILFLYHNAYNIQNCEYADESLLITLLLPSPLPFCFSNGKNGFYITGRDDTVRIRIPVYQNKIRIYYQNYKDYDYIPSEDYAIPKSISCFMEKSLRIPAKASTCYSYIPCDEAFLRDKHRQTQLLSYSLPYYLSIL